MPFKLSYLLFGRRCVACGRLIDLLSAENLCGTCRSNLVDISRNFYTVNDTDRFLAAYAYRGRLTHILRRIKTRRDDDASDTLAGLLFDAMRGRDEFLGADVVVCVPRYVRAGTTARPYNLSYELAERIAGYLGAEFCPDALIKRRNVRSQTSCSSRAVRLRNVRGAFALNGDVDISGRKILLIDDIYTTGATLSECAHALRSGKPESVSAAAVAHGIPAEAFGDMYVNKDDAVDYDVTGMDMDRVRARYAGYEKLSRLRGRFSGR